MFAAVTFGGMIGGFVFGIISDYWGRQNSAVTALMIFGIMSLVTVGATSVSQLIVLRLLTGFGIGTECRCC